MLTQGLARMVDEYPMAVCAGFPDDRARRTRGFGVLGQGSVSDCPVQHHSPLLVLLLLLMDNILALNWMQITTVSNKLNAA